jgi:hypothetical protein
MDRRSVRGGEGGVSQGRQGCLSLHKSALFLLEDMYKMEDEGMGWKDLCVVWVCVGEGLCVRRTKTTTPRKA